MAFSKAEKTYNVAGMEGAREFPVRVTPQNRFISWFKIACLAGAAVLLLAGIGFLLFSCLIHDQPVANVRAGDAIVVLTGGEARIPEAIKLLAQGKGRRLLISGVNPVTTRTELSSLMPDSRKWFRCCIDVDKVARDTIGNANETRSWVKKRGFRSLIVVTASYHMPRSIAELRRALPDVELIPYPVQPRNLHTDSWWAHPGTLQFLAMEYVKFVPALGRCMAIEIGRNRGLFGGTRQCLNMASS
ncbi:MULTISPECIES: YdcF family protein [Rhodomicrobium]|uniref:YdcF family protein n=1 Tax=Rhodomicrobium TaxID=1068 RepID=UPI0014828941|nr:MULTISPECIES: YdcF family protein [Rhodomicrobium]